jgi:2-amino-4-hydroxy-6-hydroxymethyldihydropteridine diphosphokinase
MQMSDIAYLSLGSNIGDREKHLRDAISRLAEPGHVSAVSSFYETEPVELMAEILDIEQQLGRRRVQEKGPRTIDIDILLFGDSIVDRPKLTIPHPAMAARRFVLEPLAEIAPDTQHPVLRKTVRRLLNELPAGQVVRRIEGANE